MAQMKGCKAMEPKPLQKSPLYTASTELQESKVHTYRYQLRVLTRPGDTVQPAFRSFKLIVPQETVVLQVGSSAGIHKAPLKTAPLEHRPWLFAGAGSSQTPASYLMQDLAGTVPCLNLGGERQCSWERLSRCPGWEEGRALLLAKTYGT